MNEGRANAFSIAVYDETGNKLPCFPNELTIIQGSQVGNATLPYNIGIEAHDAIMDRDVFVPFKGLEKNQSLPAVGIRNGLKVPRQLNPGNGKDHLIIPIYQGEMFAEGSSAIYNDHVTDIVITGDDVPDVVSAGSEIDITIKVDNSQGYHLDVFFIQLGETVEKDIVVESRSVMPYNEWLDRFMEAQNKLRVLKRTANQGELSDIEDKIAELDQRKENEHSKDDDMQKLLDDLRRVCLALEKVEEEHEWDTVETELRDEFDRLERANNETWSLHDDAAVAEMRRVVDQTIRMRDVRAAHGVLQDLGRLITQIALPAVLVGFLQHHQQQFGRFKWRNATAAKQLLNQGMEMANNNPDWEDVRQVCVRIIDLLPIEEQEKVQL